jgi:hypothetical protein
LKFREFAARRAAWGGGDHCHRTHLRMILIDRARLLVRWSDGEQSKIRMQETRGKISGSKICHSGNGGGNGELTSADRKWQSRRCGGRRTGLSTPFGTLCAAGFAAARPVVCTLVALANDEVISS